MKQLDQKRDDRPHHYHTLIQPSSRIGFSEGTATQHASSAIAPSQKNAARPKYNPPK